jgi:hypothetical protein
LCRLCGCPRARSRSRSEFAARRPCVLTHGRSRHRRLLKRCGPERYEVDGAKNRGRATEMKRQHYKIDCRPWMAGGRPRRYKVRPVPAAYVPGSPGPDIETRRNVSEAQQQQNEILIMRRNAMSGAPSRRDLRPVETSALACVTRI